MSQIECPVCMLEFGKDSRNTVTTECGHKFHYTCLFKWNQDNSSCPLCRKDFEDIEPTIQPESHAQAQEEFLLRPRDLLIPAEAYGMRLSCQRCNERVDYCSNSCGKLICYCQGPQENLHIRNRSPIQQLNTEYPICADCWRNRYHTVHDFLDQQMTRDLLTDEMYDNEQMYEYYEMFFNNTNGNYVDENGSVSVLQHTTFTDYEDFLEHIKDTHRRHIYIAEDLEEYEESAAETIATLNATINPEEDVPELEPINDNDNDDNELDIDNLFSVFGIEPEENGVFDSSDETELDEAEEVEEDVEVEVVGDVEANEWVFEGKKYLVDDDNDVMSLNGIVIGKRIIVDGSFKIQPV